MREIDVLQLSDKSLLRKQRDGKIFSEEEPLEGSHDQSLIKNFQDGRRAHERLLFMWALRSII